MVPARHRGWLSVLVGGLGTSGGYLAASGAAGWLEPLFSWRILWLLNVPTGLLVILLSRFIPESPRFLLHIGRVAEAENTLARFNIKLVRTRRRSSNEKWQNIPSSNCSANLTRRPRWRFAFMAWHGGW